MLSLLLVFVQSAGANAQNFVLASLISSRLQGKAGTSLKLLAIRNRAGIKHVHPRTVPSPVT